MKLEVFFDYTCPYCYLALHELNQLLPSYPELSVTWSPCELNPQPEPRFYDWEESAQWLIELKPRLESAGLTINPPYPTGNYTYLAIQGLLCLEEQGADIRRYNDAVYNAVFRDGKDIENLDVLSDCAAYAGGEVNAFRLALVSETYKERRLALSKYAWEENHLDTVPSYRLGQARLNAVYGVGVLKEQMIEFLDEQKALYSGDK